MNSNNRKYWIAWTLEKSNVRVRLKRGPKEWEMSPMELARHIVADSIWLQLKESVALKSKNCTIDIQLDPKPATFENLDFTPELLDLIESLYDYVFGLLSKFACKKAPYKTPDAKAWGRDLAMKFTASLRQLMKHSGGRKCLEDVLFEDRTDDVGTPLPNIFNNSNKKNILQAIDEILESMDTRECESFLTQFPKHPLQLTDWAIIQWPNQSKRDTLKAWLSFLAALNLPRKIWFKLGTDPKSFEVFKKSPNGINLAKKYGAVFSGALEDADYRSELSGWLVISNESRISNVFGKMLDAMKIPEFNTLGLRDTDRRVLLSLSQGSAVPLKELMPLFLSPFWQSISPNDVEKWLKLRGDRILFCGEGKNSSQYLSGSNVILFWMRVAASKRTLNKKQKIFTIALEISRCHDCIEFADMKKLLTPFQDEVKVELEGLEVR